MDFSVCIGFCISKQINMENLKEAKDFTRRVLNSIPDYYPRTYLKTYIQQSLYTYDKMHIEYKAKIRIKRKGIWYVIPVRTCAEVKATEAEKRINEVYEKLTIKVYKVINLYEGNPKIDIVDELQISEEERLINVEKGRYPATAEFYHKEIPKDV